MKNNEKVARPYNLAGGLPFLFQSIFWLFLELIGFVITLILIKEFINHNKFQQIPIFLSLLLIITFEILKRISSVSKSIHRFLMNIYDVTPEN